MYDLIFDYGCHCACLCGKPLNTVVNNKGLTPLTLAAKLARKEMFHHILTRERDVFWKYGEVTCAAFSLKDIDTLTTEGQINEKCALNLITHEESVSHLVLFDGILHNLLKEKWRRACRSRFYWLLALYVIFLITLSVAVLLRPLDDLNCDDDAKNSSSMSINSSLTLEISNTSSCDPCFLLNAIKNDSTQQVRAAFEILTLLFAFIYILLVIREVIFQEGLKPVVFDLVHNPLRLLLVLSCVLLLTCLAARFTCKSHHEDHLVIAALVLAWPYSLTFCRWDKNILTSQSEKHQISLKSS